MTGSSVRFCATSGLLSRSDCFCSFESFLSPFSIVSVDCHFGSIHCLPFLFTVVLFLDMFVLFVLKSRTSFRSILKIAMFSESSQFSFFYFYFNSFNVKCQFIMTNLDDPDCPK